MRTYTYAHLVDTAIADLAVSLIAVCCERVGYIGGGGEGIVNS